MYAYVCVCVCDTDVMHPYGGHTSTLEETHGSHSKEIPHTLSVDTKSSNVHEYYSYTRYVCSLSSLCKSLAYILFLSRCNTHAFAQRFSSFPNHTLTHIPKVHTHTHTLSPNQTKTKIPKQHRTEKRRGGAGPGLGVSTTRITPFSTIVSRVPKPLSLSLFVFLLSQNPATI